MRAGQRRPCSTTALALTNHDKGLLRHAMVELSVLPPMTSVKSCGSTERICDRPYVDHGTENHNSFGDNVGPDLIGGSGDGD